MGTTGLLIGLKTPKVHARPKKSMTTEIQDLNPRYWDLEFVEKTDEFMDKMGIEKKEYFITPKLEHPPDIENPDRRIFYPLYESPEFVEHVTNNYIGKSKIGQHGYNHWSLNYWGDGYEYTHLDAEEAHERNEKGKEIIHDTLGVWPDGFVFPNWDSGDDLEVFCTTLDDFGLILGQNVITKKHENRYSELQSPIFAPAGNYTWEAHSPEERMDQIDEYLSRDPPVIMGVFNVQDFRFDGAEDVGRYFIERAREEGYEEVFSDELFD
ncbi:MAG: DUF2334 domain-containing protein [Candidatus Aenigmatarchaeota archaeon]